MPVANLVTEDPRKQPEAELISFLVPAVLDVVISGRLRADVPLELDGVGFVASVYRNTGTLVRIDIKRILPLSDSPIAATRRQTRQKVK